MGTFDPVNDVCFFLTGPSMPARARLRAVFTALARSACANKKLLLLASGFFLRLGMGLAPFLSKSCMGRLLEGEEVVTDSSLVSSSFASMSIVSAADSVFSEIDSVAAESDADGCVRVCSIGVAAEALLMVS